MFLSNLNDQNIYFALNKAISVTLVSNFGCEAHLTISPLHPLDSLWNFIILLEFWYWSLTTQNKYILVKSSPNANLLDWLTNWSNPWKMDFHGLQLIIFDWIIWYWCAILLLICFRALVWFGCHLQWNELWGLVLGVRVDIYVFFILPYNPCLIGSFEQSSSFVANTLYFMVYHSSYL